MTRDQKAHKITGDMIYMERYRFIDGRLISDIVKTALIELEKLDAEK